MEKEKIKKNKGTLVIGWTEKDTLFPKPKDFTIKFTLRNTSFPPNEKNSAWNFMSLMYAQSLLEDTKRFRKLEKIRALIDVASSELKKIIKRNN